MYFFENEVEEAAIRRGIRKLNSDSNSNRRFFHLQPHQMTVIPSASEGSPYLFLKLC